MTSFAGVLNRFTELYGAAHYQAALDWVNAEAPDHPEDAALLICFRAAMLARVGNTEAALAAFEDALSAGYWYHEGALRGDPDFAPLQADERFQAIVAENGRRRKEAVATAKPLLRVLEPVATDPPPPLLIALHGNLSTVDRFSTHWDSAVERGWRVALPQSSDFSWLGGYHDWQDIDRALNELEAHLQMLKLDYPFDPARVVIAGFSRGAMVAGRAALSDRFPFSGLLWIEGEVDEALESLLSVRTPRSLRVVLAAGRSGTFIADAQSISNTLSAAGIACQIELMDSDQHEFPANFPQVLDRALRFLCP